MSSPCQECERREIGCHGRCKGYKAWKAERRKINADREKELNATPEIASHVLKEIWKYKRWK